MAMVETAFVTGADRGVGLALTEGLLAGGARVFAGQYEAEVPALRQLKIKYTDRLHVLQLDISRENSVAAAFRATSELADRLDLLINNGAILGDTKATIMDSLNYDEMMNVFNVNTLGSLRMSQTFMPLLLRSESKCLVNISSEAGSIGDCRRDSWYAYCMSKAALNMQSKLIHNRIKPLGGRVLVVHPGWVQTYMQGKLDAGAALTPKQSADSILKVVEARLAIHAEQLACEYVDYADQAMKW